MARVLITLFAALVVAHAAGDDRTVVVEGDVRRPIEITTPNGTRVRVEPRVKPAAPARRRIPVRSLVLPHVGSAYGMELLAIGPRGEVRGVPVLVGNGRARAARPAGPLAVRLRNWAEYDLAVRLVVDGRRFDVDEAGRSLLLVPRGGESIVHLPEEARPGQVTALIRVATPVEEPLPAVEPIGPPNAIELVELRNGHSTTVTRIVGGSPVAGITIGIDSAREGSR